MPKKKLWVALCLALASMIATSCGSSATTAPTASSTAPVTASTTTSTTAAGMTKVTLKKLDGTTVEKTSRKPQYGGTLRMLEYLPSASFDPFLTPQYFNGYRYFTNETLFYGDWSRGPAGTGESDYLFGFGGRTQLLTGSIAERWELTSDQKMIFHIRQGIHWWNKPPTNGRELTAADVAWTMNRMFTSPKSYFASYTNNKQNPTSIKLLDKSTVELTFPAGMALGQALIEIGGNMPMYPPDVTEKFGDNTDWKNLTGTGPFMLVDFVSSSSNTFVRNPAYWQSNPLFPKDQLPYVDGIITLQINDTSTRLAAFRTGKIDSLYMIAYEDFKPLQQQISDMQYIRTFQGYHFVLSGRVDKAELPFHDLRVRQALNMAVDKQALIDSYYSGEAEMFAFPVRKSPTFPYYVPLDQQPKAVQDLFTYNPDKAKQLLADAGYPTGFKTNVVVNSSGDAADLMAVIREDFLKVNVDMQIKPIESGVFTSVWSGRTQEQMIYGQTDPTNVYLLLFAQPKTQWDTSYWQDPKVDQAITTISNNLLRDDAVVQKTLTDVVPLILEQAWGVWLPAPYTFTVWWPWVNDFYGIHNMGYNAQGRNWTYAWVDVAQKKAMGY